MEEAHPTPHPQPQPPVSQKDDNNDDNDDTHHLSLPKRKRSSSSASSSSSSPPPHHLAFPEFHYVPRVPSRLRPGEELLDEVTQANRIARRARDAERKWQHSQRAKWAAAHGLEYTPKSHKVTTEAEQHIEHSDQSPTTGKAIHQRQFSQHSSHDALVESTSSEPKPEVAAGTTTTTAGGFGDDHHDDLESDQADYDDGRSEEDKLYCICRTLYDEDKMMIACDHCDQWFHVVCMKMTHEQADLIDIFVCPRCEPTTTERTTWKPPCARQACTRAARPPLTKYCSERCGILMAATRIAKTKLVKAPGGLDRLFGPQVRSASKREGVVIWQEAPSERTEIHRIWFESMDELHLHNGGFADTLREAVPTAFLSTDSSKEEEDLLNLHRSLAMIRSQKQATSTLLDLVIERTKLLELVYDRTGQLPPLQVVDEFAASTKKKGKNSKVGGDDAIKTQPRCGYDERLCWDDERFAAWMTSDFGQRVLRGTIELDGELDDQETPPAVSQPSAVEGDSMEVDNFSQDAPVAVPKICGMVKKRCRKHADWSVVRGNCFDTERKLQTATLSHLSEEETHLRTRISFLSSSIQAVKMYQDERLALSLARETSRTMAMGASVNGGRQANGHA